jgi:hypothetical protein
VAALPLTAAETAVGKRPSINSAMIASQAASE